MNISILKRYLRSIWRINKEESEEETKNDILSEVSFKGANLWLLFFTMIIACVGLNMDSSYAIIGAMLMSPLMAPVMGMGFSLSTNNWKMFKRCALNWLLALGISLAASTIYFLITPFTKATHALESFSHATIYDVLLAFFGGLAAFVGISRRSGIKVLAGVAVATACMPPLSTAGYGIANLHWNFFLGGSYLYIINCIYIGFAAMLLTRYMQFKKVVTFKEKPVAAKIVYVLALVGLIPAAVFAWQLMKEKTLTNNIDQYVSENFNSPDRTVLKKIVHLNQSPKQVEVYLAGESLNDKERNMIKLKRHQYHLDDLELIIHSTPNLKDLEAVQTQPEVLKELILKQEQKLKIQDSLIAHLSTKFDSIFPNKEVRNQNKPK